MIDKSAPMTQVSEYSGEFKIYVSCTQLGTAYTTTQARKVVDAWVEFFAAGPTAITDLE